MWKGVCLSSLPEPIERGQGPEGRVSPTLLLDYIHTYHNTTQYDTLLPNTNPTRNQTQPNLTWTPLPLSEVSLSLPLGAPC